MKKLATAALIAVVVLGATIPAAFAMGHPGMSLYLSPDAQLAWEVMHFAVHLEWTFQAIVTYLHDQQLGLQLLALQAECAGQGNLTTHLFNTAGGAVATFFATILVGALLFVEVSVLILRLLRKVWPPRTHAFV